MQLTNHIMTLNMKRLYNIRYFIKVRLKSIILSFKTHLW